MNMFILYLALQASTFFAVLHVVVFILSFLLLTVGSFCAMKHETKEHVNPKLLTWLKSGAISWAVIVCLIAILPSTQTMLVLVGINEVMQLDGIAELPQNLVDLINKTLEDLK